MTRLFTSLLERNTNTRRTTRTTSTTAPTAPRSPYTRLFLVLNSQVSPLYHSVSVVRQLKWREGAGREREPSRVRASKFPQSPSLRIDPDPTGGGEESSWAEVGWWDTY